jgi:hypothetical protein
MTLIIQKPTGGKLNLSKIQLDARDADANTYMTAVQTADGQPLELGVRLAITDFVVGCKADGIWNAIKASCILAGARTLTGALVPLVGAAPTNLGPFVSGDYNRKTGLGDASNTSKYLNSNRNNNADPQNSHHLSIYASSAGATGAIRMYIGGRISVANDIYRDSNALVLRNRGDLGVIFGSQGSANGFIGHTRSNASNVLTRVSGSSLTTAITSSVPDAAPIFVFARSSGGVLNAPTDARLAFYSIGESLNLALLDARVTDLINAFAAAIP